MSRPLLSLVMIVKDEARTIRDVLRAVKPHVDRWTILDTGSTDGTQDIVREAMEGLAGTLHEEPFVDFATSRNRVMDLDRCLVNSGGLLEPEQWGKVPIFQLMLSGDEYLINGLDLRAHLEKHRESKVDCHLLRITVDGEATSMQARVLRTGSDWSYAGVVHETPVHPDKQAPYDIVEGAEIKHRRSTPLQEQLDTISSKHIPQLEQQLQDNPNDERALIFLAQSYNAIRPYVVEGEQITLAMQAMSLYLRRLNIPTGGAAERNYCIMQYLDCARAISTASSFVMYTNKELHARCARQAEADPHRPEMALLAALTAVNVEEPRKVYKMARHAVEAALAVKNIKNVSTVDLGVIWRAHAFAAQIAQLIAERHPKDRWQGMLFSQLAAEHQREAEKHGAGRQGAETGENSEEAS